VTQLGARIADLFIWALGFSSLGLAYALALAELVLSLCMPSTTARAAGVFVPIITSLSRSFDSLPSESAGCGEVGWGGVGGVKAGVDGEMCCPNSSSSRRPANIITHHTELLQTSNARSNPTQLNPNPPNPADDPSSKRLGEFLFMSQAQVSSATSAMFYLGGAQTPVAITLAANQGVVIQNPFDTYFRGSVVPSLVLIAAVPGVVYALVRPEVRKTPWARKEARARLKQRGRPAWREWVMMATLVAAVALWVSAVGGLVAGRGDCWRAWVRVCV